nr:uncharacterized protein CI109_006706 [Kwoniella shandongensis]KAA5524982.1 hypothetical protein CI109_006706 [Kwoniella shandongensis]
MARPPSPDWDSRNRDPYRVRQPADPAAPYDNREWDRRRPTHPVPTAPSASSAGGSNYAFSYSSRRSRSPQSSRRDRERDRDRDGYSPEARARVPSGGAVRASTYRSGNHHAEDPEPGQIVALPRDYPSQRTERYDPRPRTSSFSTSYDDAGSSRLPPRPDHALPPNPTKKMSLDRPPSVASSSRPHSPVQRRVQSPVAGITPASGSVAGALEAFTRAMRDTILSHSDRDIAHKHFTALAKFPHTNPTSPHFEEAERRVRQAERALHDQMTALEGSFNEVMKRTVGKTDVIQEGDVAALEVDALKERLKRLEELSSGVSARPISGIPSTARGPAIQTSTDVARTVDVTIDTAGTADVAAEPSSKRIKLKAMLDDIIARLSAVEGAKDSLESRCEELENEMSLMESDASMKLDQGIRTWEELEAQRDPEKRRSKKRKERDEDLQEVSRNEREPSTAAAVHATASALPSVNDPPATAAAAAAGTSTTSTTNASGTSSIEGLSIDPRVAKFLSAVYKETTALRQEVANARDKVNHDAIPPALVPSGNTDTYQQISTFQSELASLKGEVKSLKVTTENAKPVDIAPVSADVKSLQDHITRIDKDLAERREKDVSRSHVLSHISTGISDLSNLIQQTRNDNKQIREEREASKQAETTRAGEVQLLKSQFEWILKEFKTESEKRDADQIAAKEQIEALKSEVQALRDGIKELTDGREAWTRDVMTACLTTVKEDMREEYAQIAFRELKKIVDKKVAQRAPQASGSNRGLSEGLPSGSTSPSIPPSTALATASVPAQSTATVSPKAPPTAPTTNASAPQPAAPATIGLGVSAPIAQSSTASITNDASSSTALSGQIPTTSGNDSSLPSGGAPIQPALAARLDDSASPTHKITLKFGTGVQSSSSHPLASRITHPVPSPITSPQRPTLSERMTSGGSAESLRARITPSSSMTEEALLNGGQLSMIDQLKQGQQSPPQQ